MRNKTLEKGYEIKVTFTFLAILAFPIIIYNPSLGPSRFTIQ